ncbi:MAG: hypothetical protein U0798_03755 [Gemmataceae bacterium]
MVLASGCQSKNNPTVVIEPKPLAGKTLSISISDPALRNVLGPIARSWAVKTGAIVTESTGEDADIQLYRPMDFGVAASQKQILPLPKELRDSSHPYQILNVADSFVDGLASWAGQPYGVMLSADESVLIYRKDRFDEPANRTEYKTRFNRDLAPPASWENAATIAEFFTKKDGKPCLAPLPKDTNKLLDLFDRVAACTDRPAITPTGTYGRKINEASFAAEVVSFEFEYPSCKPRLTAPGFTLALEILAALQPSRATSGSDDPITCLNDGAIFAVVSMSEINRLPRDANGAVSARYGIAPLPGTLRYYDSLLKTVTVTNGSLPNFVPYFSGGWIGAVRAKCANPDAAFELLAELGGPNGSAAVVSEPACGSGPWRSSLLDAGRKSLWLAYGFKPDQTDALRNALKPYVATDLRNPVIQSRGPGMEPLRKALAEHVRAALTGKTTPIAAMAAAQADWVRLEAQAGPDVITWRKGDMRGK